MSAVLQFDRTAARRIREERGLTRRDLANKLDRNLSAVQRWELGLRVPFIDVIGEIADALGVDYTELLTRAEVPAR